MEWFCFFAVFIIAAIVIAALVTGIEGCNKRILGTDQPQPAVDPESEQWAVARPSVDGTDMESGMGPY